MRKIVLIILALLPIVSTAQNKNHIGVQVSYLYGLSEYTNFNTDASIVYSRDIGKIFHLGAGVGLGTSRFNRMEFDELHTYPLVYAPVFLRTQIDFSQKQSHTYGAVKIGTRLGKTEEKEMLVSQTSEQVAFNRYNPYLANITPSIGYELRIGRNRIGIEVCYDILVGVEQSFRYDESAYNGKGALNDYYIGRFWNSIGFGITYLF